MVPGEAKVPSPSSREEGRDLTSLSVVVPLYNESEVLPELHRRLTDVLDGLDLASEVILVDDGSSDETTELVRGIARQDSRFKFLKLSRNFGHQAAFYAGLCHADGDVVVLMDGDLQDPPELIPDLVEDWRQGYDVVYAVRRSRKEGWLKRTAYQLYYRLLERIAYIPIPKDTGDFSLVSRRVASLICEMPERNKFLRGLRSWVGFRQKRHEYDRAARYAGETKYTFRKLLTLALDGLVAYSYVPLRIFYVAGGIVSIASFLLASVYFFQRIFTERYIPQGFTTLAILILFIGGIQLLALGLVGEYLGRIYDEVKRRPEFIVEEQVGLEEISGA